MALRDLGVVDQAAHGIHAAGELEGLDRPFEALVELRDRVLETTAEVPADRGEQEMRREGHAREKQDQKKSQSGSVTGVVMAGDGGRKAYAAQSR
jgi:hypothetical protein